MKRFFQEGISHLTAILAVMLLTFWVTDRFNSAMAFINHEMTKGLCGAFALLGICLALVLATDLTSPLCKTRLIVSLLTFLASAGLMGIVATDRVNPRLLLFVNDNVKFCLLGVILLALFASVLGICCRRTAWKKTFEAKENSK